MSTDYTLPPFWPTIQRISDEINEMLNTIDADYTVKEGKTMDDGLLTLVGLLSSMAMGPSNDGARKDGKICTAQSGECRYNHRYYTPGMKDAKSWSMPCADDSCPDRCGYLQDTIRDMGTEEERQERVNQFIHTTLPVKARCRNCGDMADLWPDTGDTTCKHCGKVTEKKPPLKPWTENAQTND